MLDNDRWWRVTYLESRIHLLAAPDIGDLSGDVRDDEK